MNAANYITLAKSTTDLLMSGKIKTQNHIVEIARVWMTDLKISFKQALELVNDLLTKLLAS